MGYIASNHAPHLPEGRCPMARVSYGRHRNPQEPPYHLGISVFSSVAARGNFGAPAGVLDGGQRLVRPAPAPGRGPLPGLEVLVDHEEVLDLVALLGLQLV